MFHRPIKRAATRAFVVVVGVALLATACGSSAPTVAEFNSQANGICQTYSAKLKSISADLALAKSTNSQKFRSDLSSAVTQVEQGSSQLQNLARPTAENGALKRAFKSQDVQVKHLKDILAASKTGDQKSMVSSVTAFQESEAPLNQQFDVLGLRQCGSG